jgi:tagatose-6-phosphate ketose/aldose isomerase
MKEIGSKCLVKTRISIGAGAEIISANGRTPDFVAPDVRMPLEDDYRPPVDIIFGQLLGLFFSLHWKLKPDNPSPNGAISRVVQNVNLY